jgi:2'-5' RNA ligase
MLLAIIAKLTRVDVEGKFDTIFDKYYSFLNNEYMVTVANVVGNSAMIALAKPHLIQRITAELLKVEDISLSPHLTAECKRVIAEEAVKTFDAFFQDVEDKEQVIVFVKRQLDSTRVTLREQAHWFLTRWG